MDNASVDPPIKPDRVADTEKRLAAIQKKMYDGDFASAEQMTRGFLGEMPDHVDGTYMLAVSQRQQKKYEAAQQSLNHLRALAPEFGRAFQEQAHLYRELGQANNALNAYQMATQFNPALDASWRYHCLLYTSDAADE